MPTEHDMIEAINDEHGEGIRLAEHVYISWLEDLGDPRAEAWRVLIEAGKRPSLWDSPMTIKFSGWNWVIARYPDRSYWLDQETFIGQAGSLIKAFRTFSDAMNAAAVAWVRCHRDPEFELLDVCSKCGIEAELMKSHPDICQDCY